MRILLSKESKKELYKYLKNLTNSNNIKELAKKLRVSKNTLDNWFYDKKAYISENKIPKQIINKLKIIDKKPDNWGSIKGGKKTYQIILKKYGIKEIRRRQSKGGEISLLRRDQRARDSFKVDINNPLFLEFYGALLGDGWLSTLSYQYRYKKNLWWVGICGHSKLDKEYLMFLGDIINKLFIRKFTTKYKKNKDAMEIIFSYKYLILFMNKELGFPIGKKINLKIDNRIVKDWSKLKYTIRGIFDTDGCFYLDKTPVGRPYPCISISMKAPILIKQIYSSLIDMGFKVNYKKRKDKMHRITLKGRKQLNKWMEEIGSSNPKHLNKINALVAQQDSATPS